MCDSWLGLCPRQLPRIEIKSKWSNCFNKYKSKNSTRHSKLSSQTLQNCKEAATSYQLPHNGWNASRFILRIEVKNKLKTLNSQEWFTYKFPLKVSIHFLQCLVGSHFYCFSICWLFICPVFNSVNFLEDSKLRKVYFNLYSTGVPCTYKHLQEQCTNFAKHVVCSKINIIDVIQWQPCYVHQHTADQQNFNFWKFNCQANQTIKFKCSI